MYIYIYIYVFIYIYIYISGHKVINDPRHTEGSNQTLPKHTGCNIYM